MQGSKRRRVATFVGLTALGWGIEVLLVGKIDPQETPVGFGVALVAAAAAVAALHTAELRYALRLAWLAQIPRVVRNVVRDTVTVLAAIAAACAGRAPDAGVVELPVDPGGSDPVSAARRALVIAAVNAAPNTIVLDLDRERGILRVHALSRRAVTAPASPEWPL